MNADSELVSTGRARRLAISLHAENGEHAMLWSATRRGWTPLLEPVEATVFGSTAPGSAVVVVDPQRHAVTAGRVWGVRRLVRALSHLPHLPRSVAAGLFVARPRKPARRAASVRPGHVDDRVRTVDRGPSGPRRRQRPAGAHRVRRRARPDGRGVDVRRLGRGARLLADAPDDDVDRPRAPGCEPAEVGPRPRARRLRPGDSRHPARAVRPRTTGVGKPRRLRRRPLGHPPEGDEKLKAPLSQGLLSSGGGI
jgi:hypothetical protein